MADETGKNTTEQEQELSNGLFGQTDRSSGEYHFRNGHTEQVYSNASYFPASEETEPKQYYEPAAKKPDSSRKKGLGGLFAVMALCLVCALIGGVSGALLVQKEFSTRIETLEAAQKTDDASGETSDSSDKIVLSGEAYDSGIEIVPAGETLSASDIYNLACMQVVSVNTEYVAYYYNGYSIPSNVSGSGFVITDSGYILTNYHVIKEAAEGGYSVGITTYSGDTYDGRVTAYDIDSDIAIVKIDATSGLSAATLGDSTGINVGDSIYTVGNPFGMLEFTMSSGQISALNREVATESSEKATTMFQIDAAVFEGNSGGPVYNDSGEVIGIVTAKYSSGTEYEGIGFAIPINTAMDLVTRVVESGYTMPEKASIGIVIDERYTTMFSRYYRLPSGAYIHSVDPGSCAETAGITAGDVITRIGDSEISEYSEVQSIIKGYNAGDTAEIEIYRDGAYYTTGITFDKADRSNGISYYSPGRSAG